MDAQLLRQADELEDFLKACAIALGISPSSIIRFPVLFQIMDTGIDVVWDENTQPEGRPGWILRQTYVEVDLSTQVAETHTEDVVSAEPHETALIAKAAFQLITDHLLDAALSEVVPREGS